MSADLELLRRAEALIHERANALEGRRWAVRTDTKSDYPQQVMSLGNSAVVADTYCGPQHPAWEAEHIASWSPFVALLVADVIHQAAADLWAHGPLCICTTGCDACDDNLWEPHVRNALALARAYIGETA